MARKGNVLHIHYTSDELMKEKMSAPNKVHLEACKRGATITRNRKKYTRKSKHKKDWRDVE
jgi:hypothetical protein